jgi:hypothetical protein
LIRSLLLPLAHLIQPVPVFGITPLGFDRLGGSRQSQREQTEKKDPESQRATR